MVRIPFLSSAEAGAPLQRCIDMAAERSGVGVDGVVVAMSLLFEAIADEMTRGRVVRVPGFGLFAPAPIPLRHRKASRDLTPRCRPAFSPSRGPRAQVALGLGPLPENIRALARHRKNHQDSTSTSRVFTAMQVLRRQVALQLGRTGT